MSHLNVVSLLQRQLDTLPNLVAARLTLSQTSLETSRREAASPSSRNNPLALRNSRPTRAQTIAHPDSLFTQDAPHPLEPPRDVLSSQGSPSQASRDLTAEHNRAATGSIATPIAQVPKASRRPPSPTSTPDTQETSFSREAVSSPSKSQGTQSHMTYRGRSSQA